MNSEGARRTLQISLGHFAPDAADAVYREAVRSLRPKRIGPTTDAFLPEFQVPRRKAGMRMETEGGLPGKFAPISHMRNAALPKNGEPLVSASIPGTLAFAATAKQVRRLLGYCGSAASKDALVAADADLSSENENGCATWLARHEAKGEMQDG